MRNFLSKKKMSDESYDWVGLRDWGIDGWFNQSISELAPGFPIAAGEWVIDVGCGAGGFARFCAEKGANVILADIDKEKVRQAESLVKPYASTVAIEALVTDAAPLPIAAERVDKVVCLEVLEHVNDPLLFLSELVRVAKPGGRFLLSTPSAASEHLQKDLAPDSYFLPPNHVRIFEPGKLVSLVESFGLVVEKQFSYGFYHSLWWMFFWACKENLTPPGPPLLQSWSRTWALLLESSDGLRIKHVLDKFLPKSQCVIARKPL